MTVEDPLDPRQWSLEGLAVPAIVTELAGRYLEVGDEPELAWRNQADGLTFRIGDRYLKWNPAATGIDLEREGARLRWLEGRHPAPRVLDTGTDGDAQWMLTAAVPGRSVVQSDASVPAAVAVRAIADGLRALHAVPIDAFPADWAPASWVNRAPDALGPRPSIDAPVLVHGDACAPNTLLGDDGRWAANVDFGDLSVGDRWADLAVASMSLGWNFGDGWETPFYDAYGIEPDPERIRYYRALWDLES